MIVYVETENGSCDPDHALLWVDLIQTFYAKFEDSSFSCSTVPEISLGASKFKEGHVTLTTPLHLAVLVQ